MAENIRLFINDKEIEFVTEPKILYTYQESDVVNPTVVKNNFSKTVTIEGTPNNNDVFGHFWDVERYLLNGGSGGAYYNSSKKAPFQLFKGSDLYEEGYCKLDSVIRESGVTKYNITLFGGLGDLFFSLATSDNGDKRKLSDLTFMPSGDTDEFDFTMNIDAVNTAWKVLRGEANPNLQENRKWAHINFIPCYNGKPDSFDSDKIIINLSGTSLSSSVKDTSGKTFSSKQNFTVGDLPQEMTEWDTRDLRSYNQRPCIKMSSIINACCKPENNNGYTINLDPDFFSQDNPYWNKTYVTLPMITKLEYDNDQQVLEGAELVTATTTGDSSSLMYQDLRFDLGEINGNVSDITVKAQITPYLRYPFTWTTSYVWFWNWNAMDYHTGWWCLGSLFVQMIAMNGDTVVGASDVYNLTTPIRHYGGLWYGHNGHYPDGVGYDSTTGRKNMSNGSKYYPYMDKTIYNVLGKFTSDGFVEETSHNGDTSVYSNTAKTFTFTIRNINTNITGLKMVYYWGATADKVDKVWAPNKLLSVDQESAWMFREHNPDFRPIETSEHNLTLVSHNLTAVMGESLGRTGTKVTKQLLLNTESSPCDYLLSYCKMFGLHFVKEVGSKTVDILTRKSFYERNNIVDLEDMIDHGKRIDIQPIMFESKWYQFLQEKDESDFQKRYLTANGVEYGCKILDTGYEFNAEKIDLLDGNCLKSGIEGLEKSKWFTAYNNDDSMRPWMNIGLKYTLWNGSDEFEVNAGQGSSGTILPINEGDGMKYYDIFPKLQFHGSDNDPTDGSNCLVFYSGTKNVTTNRSNPITYILSDDSVYQTDMNEGTPCWLFTKQEVVNNKRLCYKVTKIPVFERYLTSNNSGTVSKSLDFGSPQELYIPSYNLTDQTNIYYNFWRTYLSDLFNINTRQMTCYVMINGNPNVEWLRRFYYFDHGIWRISRIVDWNPASNETTKVEFIKVQDIENYTSVTQGNPKTIELSASTYNVGPNGAVITLTISGLTSGVRWRLTRSGDAVVRFQGTEATTISGTGNTTRTVVFSSNVANSLVGQTFRVVRSDNGQEASVYIAQGYNNESSVVAAPVPVLLPYSGGSIDYTFEWYNQGSQYITNSTTSGTINVTSVDVSTEQQQNRASVVYGANNTTGSTNGSVTFTSTNGLQAPVEVYQVPQSYSFSGAGHVHTMQLGVTGATFTDIPFWITTASTPVGGYIFVANTTLYDTGRTDTMKIWLNGYSAEITMVQGMYFNVIRTDGNGDVLPAGGSVTVSVTSQNPWTAVTSADYVTMSSSSGTTSSTITITFDENSGDARIADFVFTDSQGQVRTFRQTQSSDSSGSAKVIPSSLVYDATGGSQTITIKLNQWSVVSKPDWASVSTVSGSTSGTTEVTVPPYSGTAQRSQPVVILDMDPQGQHTAYSVILIQLPADGEMLAVTPSSIRFEPEGGTGTITIISNTDWTIG